MKDITPNMNDDELDDLFREAAANYSPAKKEEVWDKIQEKLGDRPGRRKPVWWMYLIAFLLGISGLLLWQYFGMDTGKQIQQPQTVSKGNKKASSLFRQKASRGKEKENQVKKKVFTISNISSGTGTTPIITHFSCSRKEMNESDKTVAANLRLTPIKTLAAAFVFSQHKRPIQIPAKSQFTFDSGRHFLPQISSAKVKAEFKTKNNLSLEKIPHWQLGLTAGPDWSSAATKGWRTGIGGGVELSYQLNRKWALSTGVLVDKKLYDAHPADYDPPDNNWQNYDVKSINANCKVLDVPLNVEYMLWNNNGHRYLLSAGLSSFWMLEEKYTYIYKTNAGTLDQWDKELYDKNHHLFSILNLSAGYEKSWKHFSFEVAPYIKIPLSGIGYGRVKLYSTGIHFTLKYGLK